MCGGGEVVLRAGGGHHRHRGAVEPGQGGPAHHAHLHRQPRQHGQVTTPISAV